MVEHADPPQTEARIRALQHHEFAVLADALQVDLAAADCPSTSFTTATSSA
jgi:hypothetical protein